MGPSLYDNKETIYYEFIGAWKQIEDDGKYLAPIKLELVVPFPIASDVKIHIEMASANNQNVIPLFYVRTYFNGALLCVNNIIKPPNIWIGNHVNKQVC